MLRFLNGSKMLKKGVVAIQFNWILVLIIGGMILILFMSIVQKQKQISEEDIAGTIQTDLQAILTSSQVSTGTASIVEMPNKEIKFDCRTGKPGFILGNQNPATFPYAFAPDLIKSDRSAISIYAYDWSVPYRVTNFLYVTSPDIKYLIINDSNNNDILDSLNALLPPQYIVANGQQKLFMNREIVDFSSTAIELTDTNNYKVRAVYVGYDLQPVIDLTNALTNTKRKDLSAVMVSLKHCSGMSAEEQLDCYGEVTFYNYNITSKNWSSEVSTFVGKAALLAAIFSENKELYECGMNNALKRLKSISEVYRKKAVSLSSDASSCSNLYTSAASNASAIINVADIIDSSTIYSNSASLKLTNENLFESSCPPLY